MSTSTSHPEHDLPLAGIRVLDLSRVFAGPMCGMVLGDFGAEVIKVEHPGRGDDTRDWGIRIGKTETTYYNSMNRNKRSITVDLQTPEGQQLIHDLLPQFDVVIQNFKFGGPASNKPPATLDDLLDLKAIFDAWAVTPMDGGAALKAALTDWNPTGSPRIKLP